MNCAEFESVLADYLDGTLVPSERVALEQHTSLCDSCREFMVDVSGGLKFLQRVPDVAPPPELVTRIAFHAPVGRTRHPSEQQGILSRLAAKWLQPILQPRLAMGLAMTVLSFAVLERCTGVQIQHIQAADLNPVRILGSLEDKTLCAKDRVVKYYDNIRLVYEIETRLNDLQEQETSQAEREARKRSSAQALPPANSQESNRSNGGTNPPKQGDNKP
jgi:hypothetical protein